MSADTSAETRVRGDLPPLRIHHFLVCIAVAAVLLTWLHSQMTPQVQNLKTTLVVALHSTWYLIIAAGITVGAFLLYWRVKGIAAFA